MLIAKLPPWLLRLEGLAVLGGSLGLYVDADFGWILFLALILVPDLSMLGYLGGVDLGTVCYDIVHTYVLPIVLAVAGVLAGADTATQVALIWLAHIGVDRFLGYGLKYPSGFKETHLQRV